MTLAAAGTYSVKVTGHDSKNGQNVTLTSNVIVKVIPCNTSELQLDSNVNLYTKQIIII